MANEEKVLIFPIVWKMDSTGAVREWKISVLKNDDETASIVITYGQKGGKMQTTETVVKAGKNDGRSNSTDCYEQARSEAISKWKKQLDKGYGESSKVEKATQKPMLAHKYADYKHKVVWPAYAQPKLDGIRCLARQEGDDIILMSRGNKPITTMGHIVKELKLLMHNKSFSHATLDGELYVHGARFQDIVSWVKREQAESLKVEYHIYDVITPTPFPLRFNQLAVWCMTEGLGLESIKEVMYRVVRNEKELEDAHNQWVMNGYEGAMLRHGDCTYKEGYRSQELLKFKAFIDDEFEIIGARQGEKGRSEGMAIFRLKTKDGGEFDCMPEGTREERQDYWNNYESAIGKMMTVRFFGWTTSSPSLPRFPIGVTIRDYEG